MGTTNASRKGGWLVLMLVLAPALYSLYSPLMLSLDSLYGFLAYKGTMDTGRFNVIADVSPTDINQLQHGFVSWWSPGQWLAPGFIHAITGMPVGLASIMVTLVFALAGIVGYYQVFRYYRFPPHIIMLSLCSMALSETFNIAFLVYQGGEILSLGVFPWFFLFVMQTRKPSAGRLALITLFFLVCFVAKTTLIIYCGLVLLYKITEPVWYTAGVQVKRPWIKPAGLLYLLPVLVAVGIIHFFFMTRGPTPHLIGHKPDISAQNLMTPLTSPVTSVLSLRKIPAALERLPVSSPFYRQLLVVVAYLPFLWLAYAVIRYMWKASDIPPAYKRSVTLLCVGAAGFFLFAYIMGTNIDRSARHLKFAGFLLLPVMLLLITRRLPPRYARAVLALLLAGNIGLFVYHKYQLTKGKYVGATWFYRSNLELTGTDNMDRSAYQKMLQFDKRYNPPGTPHQRTIFLVEASLDVALAIHGPCIAQRQNETIWQRTYAGRGPTIVACVVQRAVAESLALLKQTFPDCRDFRLEDQTGGYQFFIIK